MSGYYKLDAACRYCAGELDHIAGGFVHRAAGHPVHCPGRKTTARPFYGVTVGCNACTGVIAYRVKLSSHPAEQDNFDQLVDHRPAIFTWADVLKAAAEATDDRSITVWRLADADQGGDWSKDTVIAYAGPHPSKPGERTWLVDLSGHGFYDELLEAVPA